ncbi:MAG: tetratricopeptide repeat protein [Nitrospirae bacterium]|nr:tetratricopeptide repeat protein [Nitrospirota bacterium]
METERRLIYLIILILVSATFFCYLPLRYNDFVTYDDYDYIVNNTRIHSGLTMTNIRWAFTTSYFSYWHPLAWISHMADIELFGLNPRGHHMMNLFFHIADTVLLFLCLRLMTGRIWASAFVAALFALHPMSVDSVAWAAERKNVLSTFFWFLILIFYVYYVRRPVLWRYLSVLAAFACGLMSKPMLVTVPFFLLLLDYWPLGRYKAGKQAGPPGLITEKVPFFILSAVSLFMTILPEWRIGTVITLEGLPLGVRIIRAINSYTGYLVHMVNTARLTVLYPYLKVWPWWETTASSVFLVSATVASIAVRKKYPYVLTGWFWYLGTLVPVLQVFQVNLSPMADRYTYVPIVGIFIVIAWGAGDISDRIFRKKTVNAVAAVLILTVLGAFTWKQIGYWRDSGTLYKHAIDVTEFNYMAYNNYGVYLMESGKVDEAVVQFDKGLQIVPYNDELNFNMGAALIGKGKIQEAQRYLLGSARLWYKGDRTEFYKRLSSSLVAEKKYAEAVEYITKLILINPKDVENLKLLSEALAGMKRYAEALAAIEKGISLSPKDADLFYRKGAILTKMGAKEAAEK